MRPLIQSVLAAALLIVATGSSASAAEIITVAPESTILRAEAGTRTNLTEVNIESRFVGRRCRIDVISQNQSSIHNGNDLIITTGSVETVIADVEAEANLAVDLSTEIVLGDTLSVDLLMGPDRISSLGFSLSLECGLQETVQLGTGGLVEDPTGSTTTTTTAPQPPPPPPLEVATPGPGLAPPICPEVPVGAATAAGGSLTVDTTNCPVPEPTTTTVPPTTIAPPTTAATPTTAAPAAATPATTATTQPATQPATGQTSSTSKENDWSNGDVEVLGIQVNRLPRTAPATAIPKAPNYNG